MGKIIKMGPIYGFIKPHNQENNIYFKTAELVSYVGIIDVPIIGDEVVYSLGQNPQGQPIAICIHKQCSRDVVEDLVEKFRYDTKTCSRLKKHIEDFDSLNSDTSDNSNGLAYYLEKVGVSSRTSFSPKTIMGKILRSHLPYQSRGTAQPRHRHYPQRPRLHHPLHRLRLHRECPAHHRADAPPQLHPRPNQRKTHHPHPDRDAHGSERSYQPVGCDKRHLQSRLQLATGGPRLPEIANSVQEKKCHPVRLRADGQVRRQ